MAEPVWEPVELFRRVVEGRKFTRQELADFLGECKKELDCAIERLLGGDEFCMIDYDLTLCRNGDNKVIGGILRGGAFFVGEAEKKFSLSRLQCKTEYGYERVFERAVIDYDFCVIDADMYLVAYRDSVSFNVKARKPKI